MIIWSVVDLLFTTPACHSPNIFSLCQFNSYIVLFQTLVISLLVLWVYTLTPPLLPFLSVIICRFYLLMLLIYGQSSRVLYTLNIDINVLVDIHHYCTLSSDLSKSMKQWHIHSLRSHPRTISRSQKNMQSLKYILPKLCIYNFPECLYSNS